MNYCKRHISTCVYQKPSLHGFTLLEILIGLVSAGLLFGAVMKFSVNNARRLGVEEMKGRIEARVQTTMTRLRTDIRYLAYDPQGVGTSSPYILVAQATSFSFLGDTNGDGTLETISYRVNGTTFERSQSNVNSGAYQPISDNLQSLTFTYFDINNASTSVLANIRKINLQITYDSEGMDPTSNPIVWRILNASETFVPRNLIL